MSDAGETGLSRAGLKSAPAAIHGGSGLRWLVISAVVIALDQLVKSWVAALPPYVPHHILPVLDITLMYNTGAAFSFLSDASGWQRWAFTGLALLVSIAIVIWMYRLRAGTHRLLACSLAFIVGGALGNMIDRLRIGHVIDFVSLHWNNHWFAAFNVADSAITVGAALLLLDALWESRGAKGRAA